MKQLFYIVIYTPFINRILRSILKIIPNKILLPISGVFSIKTKEGKKIQLKTNQTNHITALVYWKGHENFEYTNIFLDLIKKVKVFYDIGANIGYYSLLAEMQNPSIKVEAFEPATGPFFYLKENIKINEFKNISVHDIALSDQTGEIQFQEVYNKKYSYLKYNLAGDGNANPNIEDQKFIIKNVKTKTLDEFVNEMKEEKIDLIKIDTEGTENVILEQADLVLKEMKPIVICETLFNTIEPELESIFRKYGYEFYNHTDQGLSKVESITREQDNGVLNCFFVHPSKQSLISEFVVE